MSTIQEVELLVKAGLSPEAALKAATSVAARHIGLENEIGALDAGMIADILLVRGDPLRNIADLHQVDAVVQMGGPCFDRPPSLTDGLCESVAAFSLAATSPQTAGRRHATVRYRR